LALQLQLVRAIQVQINGSHSDIPLGLD